MNRSIPLTKRILLAALFFFPAFLSAQVTREWAKRYEGANYAATDAATALAVDAGGNVYVTGSAAVSGKSLDFTTIKYNGAGTMLWKKSFNGSGNGDDGATAVATDAAGNVYVTGWSRGKGTGEDFATVRYDAAGNVTWEKRYNGPGSNDDRPAAITVDGAGNVYVTGRSRSGPHTSFDYATIKYGPDGLQQWVARYNGPAGGNDLPCALAVDAAGNVYVTGESGQGGNGAGPTAITTISYDAAGTELWKASYTGSYSAGAADLAPDGSGGLYIAGWSTAREGGDNLVILRYNGEGTLLWQAGDKRDGRESHRARSLAVDASGNVYAAGTATAATGASALLALKYSDAGDRVWGARYEGAEAAGDALAVDAAGNVYVTGETSGSGSDYLTLKYSGEGALLWEKRYNGTAGAGDAAAALALDAEGNVYITGYSAGKTSFDDYLTIGYDKDGTERWTQRHAGTAVSFDRVHALALDGKGNVYVSGQSWGEGGSDFATLKYDAKGTRIWDKKYNGPAGGLDRAAALAVDGTGNVYVAGSSEGSGTGLDFALIKYDDAGARKWAKRYNGPDSSRDEVLGVAVDGAGNVYVLGESSDGKDDEGEPLFAYAVVAYDGEGNRKWTARYPAGRYYGNPAALSTLQSKAIVADPAGNVYVAGRSSAGGARPDFVTLKFNGSSGELLWATKYNGPSNSYDIPVALALDAAGNVFVGGVSHGGKATNYDYATVKYNSEGVQQWAERYHNGYDIPAALCVDRSGNVLIAGLSGEADETSDIVTVKYNNAGERQWVAAYNGPGGLDDAAYAVAADEAGNVYVTGGYSPDEERYAAVVIKYDAAGGQQWLQTFQGNRSSYVAVDAAANVYVAGAYFAGGTGEDFYTIKYAQPPAEVTRVEEEVKPAGREPEVTPSFSASHYPNPVTDVARIRYQLPAGGLLTIRLYDMMGREVAAIAGAAAREGTHTARFDASRLQKGMYFYRVTLKTDNKVWTKTNNMIIMR